MKDENEEKLEELEKEKKKKSSLSKNYLLWLILSVTISFVVGFFALTFIRYISGR